ncbi:hypothetical protein [Paenibacillus xylanilyticus]|uniref:Uncharacterized protein n=1 Tax=Paenibacillus xylanilyticus TaxID=248903 RepID=A0A7Y6BVT6_9BACL|nr:hypothetical protein [Paenibacillus xylanilyticus]NUU75726.1 hypothetical protein [Paenibacillus xylanilyticus]
MINNLSIVENIEEAETQALHFGLDVTGMDPDSVIMKVNEYIVLNAITKPVPETNSIQIELSDILTLRNEITDFIAEYRVLNILAGESKRYIVLCKLEDEHNDSYDLLFYVLDDNNNLELLTADEWPDVEKLYEEQV